MRRRSTTLIACCAAVAGAVAPSAAIADGVREGMYVPWADTIRGSATMTGLTGKDGASADSADVAPPGIKGLRHVGNSDNDAATNSDLAFWGTYAYAGNYGGFRILDISARQPQEISDFACNGAQGDPTVWDTGSRRLLFQSVDSRQTTKECTSTNAAGTQRDAFEGVRMFDVTNPANPEFIDAVETDCGSHTQTLIPDPANDRVVLYVSSYPLSGLTTPATEEGQTECVRPHKKISILAVPFDVESAADVTVKEQPLSSDTAEPPGRPFQGCHDITAIMSTMTAVGSCGGDGQIWDISDLMDPTTTDAHEGRHTHIYSPSGTDVFEFLHTSMITPDLERVVLTDETGGGGRAECDGAATDDGFYYFYPMVEPGDDAPSLISRFTIPRPQTPEICVSHNGNFIPVENRYVMPTANYMGGTSVVDWTDESEPREVAYADMADEIGDEDAWSSYWYNGRIYVNGGIKRSATSNPRGLDVYEFTDRRYTPQRVRAVDHLNPQTVD